MKRTLISVAVLSTILATSLAQAGGLDRSGQDSSIIFKDGGIVEITSIHVSPTVSGTYAAGLDGGSTSDVAPNYSMTKIAIKADINDDIAIAVIQDSPFGAKLNWSAGFLNGTGATIDSDATTVLVSYDVAEQVIVFGGLRSQSLDVSATVNAGAALQYTISGDKSSANGYVLGAAYQIPEIGMRVALTYNSKVNHSVSVKETSPQVAATNKPATIDVSTPESINLDFQTGIAANTLLFGSVRYVKWTQTNVAAPIYTAVKSEALLSYSQNTNTYNIGIGRKFTDQWSGAVTYGYEKALGGNGGPLSPTDGSTKLGVGVTYKAEKFDVTLAVQKSNLGDTNVEVSSLLSPMTGNSALITAVKIGYKF